MDVVVRSLERFAICLVHRQARNRHWLAPQRLPAVLDVESSSRPTRTPNGIERDSPTDSEDEWREFPLGRAPHPRRLGFDIGETRVGKYIIRSRKPPSQTWHTFLENQSRPWCRSTSSLISVDISGNWTASHNTLKVRHGMPATPARREGLYWLRAILECRSAPESVPGGECRSSEGRICSFGRSP